MKKLLLLVMLVLLCGCQSPNFIDEHVPEDPVDPSPIAYPDGPYGVNVGEIVPPGLSWPGYRGWEAETIHIEEFYDPDGTRGINGLLFDVNNWECSPCQAQCTSIAAKQEEWSQMGIEAVSMLLRGPNMATPTMEDALLWKQTWGFESVTVVLDPAATMVYKLYFSVPWMVVVDPRTMMVYHADSGFNDDYSSLVEILAIENMQ